MRIDLDELAIILEKEHSKTDSERGMQPELTLGCFYGQRKNNRPVEETSIHCESCRHYDSCSKYLHFAQILINPFTGARIKN